MVCSVRRSIRILYSYTCTLTHVTSLLKHGYNVIQRRCLPHELANNLYTVQGLPNLSLSPAQWSSSIKDGTKPGMPLMFESTPGSYSYGELGVSPSETDSVNKESDVGADNGNVPRKACYRAEEVAE